MSLQTTGSASRLALHLPTTQTDRRSTMTTVEIPLGYDDLLAGPICVTMTTVMADSSLQSSVVWRKHEGDHWLVGVGKESLKYRNLQANPQVAFTAIDPQNPYRYLEVRGEVVE